MVTPRSIRPMSDHIDPTERVLDWRSEHDPRSRAYPVRAAIGTVERRKKFWRAHRQRLDQGREGACVGYAWTAELMATPRIVVPPNPQHYASSLYREAQRHDEWPGENYEGTSVVAAARIIRDRGLITEYRWAFGIDDVIDTLCAPYRDGGGPVIIGIPWLDGMYQTRPSGLVEVNGRVVGGHALLCTGYHPGIRLRGEGWFQRHEVIKWRNSWGKGYGRNGDGYIRVTDLANLLANNGEACVPQGRNMS